METNYLFGPDCIKSCGHCEYLMREPHNEPCNNCRCLNSRLPYSYFMPTSCPERTLQIMKYTKHANSNR